MPFLGQALRAGAQKFLGKAIRAGHYLGRAAPHISKGLSQVQRLASNSAVQDAGKSVGIGPSVFNKIGAIAGSTNSALSALPGVANDVRAGLTGASTAFTPARRSIADLYAKANSG
jgi:hypothetical protein